MNIGLECLDGIPGICSQNFSCSRLRGWNLTTDTIERLSAGDAALFSSAHCFPPVKRSRNDFPAPKGNHYCSSSDLRGRRCQQLKVGTVGLRDSWSRVNIASIHLWVTESITIIESLCSDCECKITRMMSELGVLVNTMYPRECKHLILVFWFQHSCNVIVCLQGNWKQKEKTLYLRLRW